ncbi:MAG: ribonuclease Z, partial [Chloroflexi bacterium]|nr:ribonuclease Z [Chloroflexota bacterium]
VSTLARWESLDTIEIYGGASTLKRVSDLLFKVVFPNGRSPIDINLITIEPGVILEDKHFSLSAFPVTHRGAGCFGFVFEEKTRRPFLAEKAKALNIPVGPERAELVQGNSITLANGQIIKPEDVLGDAVPGIKYVHIGDVGRTDNIFEVCQNADTLVIESTYVNEEAEMAAQFGHMTAAKAAELARDANVNTLILTHLSRRYFERDIRNEARAIFENTYVARDFDNFQITRDGAKRQSIQSKK